MRTIFWSYVFSSESIPELFSNIDTDPFSAEDPFYEEEIKTSQDPNFLTADPLETTR